MCKLFERSQEIIMDVLYLIPFMFAFFVYLFVMLTVLGLMTVSYWIYSMKKIKKVVASHVQ